MHAQLRYSGPIRIYFDPGEPSDARWCVASVASHWHINVRALSIDGVHLRAVYAPRDESKPSCTAAWLEGRARVEITDDGRAYLSAETTAKD